MKKSALLIPVAAFAVLAGSAQAFNAEVLEEAGLSEDQIAAFSVAKDLKEEGDREGARDVLAEAGIDEETLRDVKAAMREHRQETRAAVKAAVEAEDYDAFTEAAEDTKLADDIDSEADFQKFVEAYELRQSGDREAAREILSELGIEPKEHGKRGGGGPRGDRS